MPLQSPHGGGGEPEVPDLGVCVCVGVWVGACMCTHVCVRWGGRVR